MEDEESRGNIHGEPIEISEEDYLRGMLILAADRRDQAQAELEHILKGGQG